MCGTDNRLWTLKTEKDMTLYEMKELVDTLSNNQSVWILQDEMKALKNKLTVKTHNDFYWTPKANLNRLLNLYYLLTTDYQREQEINTFYLPTGLVFAYLSVNRLINTDKRMDTKLLKTVSKIKTKQNLGDVNNYFRAYPNIEIIEGDGITIQKVRYDILEDNLIFGQEITDEIKSKLGIRKFSSGKKTICKVTVTADWKGEYRVGPDVWQVVFEEGITVIPDNILTNSKDLILLSFPSTLKAIGIRAFFESRIKRLEIPEGVEEIHEQAFSRAELEDVKLPSTLKMIIAEGFSKNCSLTRIELPEGIIELQDFAFYGCNKLKYINLPESIEKIGIGLLAGTAIEDIELPSKMKEIPERMFSKCSELSRVKIPDGVVSIDREAFSECSKLKEVTLPEELESIGIAAFTKCENIEKVELPRGVKEIGNNCFNGCSALKEIKIPDSLEKIGKNVFDYTNIQRLVLVGNKINPDIFSQIFYSIQEETISELKEIVVIIPDDKNNEESIISFLGNMHYRKPEEILEEVQKNSLEMKDKKEAVEI